MGRRLTTLPNYAGGNTRLRIVLNQFTQAARSPIKRQIGTKYILKQTGHRHKLLPLTELLLHSPSAPPLFSPPRQGQRKVHRAT